MLVRSLVIPDVKLIVPVRHVDARGSFTETWSAAGFSGVGLDFAVVQENESLSRRRGTVRGLHFQAPPQAQAKLVRVLRGAVLDVAVDLRIGSRDFGRHVAVRLDAESGAALLVPEGFAHGFVTLEPETLVQYKVSRPYAPRCEGGVLWSDPALDIKWGIGPGEAILSDRDRNWPRLAALQSPFRLLDDEVAA